MSTTVGSVEWEWSSDDKHWVAYSAECSAAIEAAFAAGHSSVPLCLSSRSTPTHTVIFQGLPQRQVNIRTMRSRPVRRQVIGDGCVAQQVSWEWWEVERGRWAPYDAATASKIEAKWKESSRCKAVNVPNGPSGLLVVIRNHGYTIDFETEARQCNNSTMFCRGVRRRSNSQPTAEFSAHGSRFALPSTPTRAHASVLSPASQRLTNFGSLATQKQPNSAPVHEQDFIPCPDSSETDDCPICISSLSGNEAVKLSKCNHVYHRGCILLWFKSRPTCPQCATPYGVILGTQPAGEMRVRYVAFGSTDAKGGLSGYAGTDIIEISYIFPSGIQEDEHPHPGRVYTGTTRVAYLPKNKDGEEILELLKIAWRRRLLFTVGTSVTTGQADEVIWSGIHHKTSTSGGSTKHGYPDETYFARVRSELAAVGVT